MPGKCTICEESAVEEKEDGEYVWACAACREAYERPPRHVETCGNDDCTVCRDHREEGLGQ